MLIEIVREWPWGLVVLGDPQDRESLPRFLGVDGVARTAATVVVGIQHAVDGAATASVSVDEPEPGGLLLLHDGGLSVAGGQLRIADAAEEQSQGAAVTPGDYELRVLVDEREHPTWVHFAIRQRK